MNSKPTFAAAVLAAGIALAILAFLPAAGATQPGFQGVGTTHAAYLQVQAAASFALAPVVMQDRGALPKSTRSSHGQQCSIESNRPGNPPRCSTNSRNKPCSAAHRRGMTCSAFQIGGMPEVICSTGAATRSQCSVLRKLGNGPASTCSSYAPTPGTSRCSIMFNTRGAFCSTDNISPVAGTRCSAIENAPGSFSQCSVLNGGTAPNNGPNTCSINGGGTNPGECSSFAPNTSCSIQPPNTGGCTVEGGAPVGQCSAHDPQSQCSIIGGQGPDANGQCRIP